MPIFPVVFGPPVPRRFDTYGMVCGLPFPQALQRELQKIWLRCLELLNHPLAYGVQPAALHTEIFLFQRPGETFSPEAIQSNIAASRVLAKETPAFKLILRHPFITPDGTIVAPGLDDPAGTLDGLRHKLRVGLRLYPQKQSQWMHVSLGRVLEPLDGQRLRPMLDEMQGTWGEIIGEARIDEILWTWERQWYMQDREVLHRCRLK